MKGIKSMTPEQRFWMKVDKQENGCWVWTAAKFQWNKYGMFVMGRKNKVAHRVAYEWKNGPVPVGLELDHLCRNRQCVNPDHLEAVTHQENCRRAHSPTAARTACPSGHPYDEKNTYVRDNGWRGCRICHYNANLRFLARQEQGVPV